VCSNGAEKQQWLVCGSPALATNHLWLPTSACPHPADALIGELNAPRLSILCRRCGTAWDQDTVPGRVIDILTELLDTGRFKPRRPRTVLT
jgi:hypothetical protein